MRKELSDIKQTANLLQAQKSEEQKQREAIGYLFRQWVKQVAKDFEVSENFVKDICFGIVS